VRRKNGGSGYERKTGGRAEPHGVRSGMERKKKKKEEAGREIQANSPYAVDLNTKV